MDIHDSTDSVTEFIEAIGLQAQADGLPRIAGRIMGLFLIEGGEKTLSEISERLQVSRASVSTNLRLLENHGALQRKGHPGERQDYFGLHDNPYLHKLEVHLQRLRKMQVLMDGVLASDQLDSAAQQRLREMEEFHNAAIAHTESFIEQWQNRSVGLTMPRRASGGLE